MNDQELIISKLEKKINYLTNELINKEADIETLKAKLEKAESSFKKLEKIMDKMGNTNDKV